MPDNMTTESVRDLRIGQKLNHDIFDPSGVLLLREGTTVTQRFVDALHARGISEVSRAKEPGEDIPSEANTEPDPGATRGRSASDKSKGVEPSPDKREFHRDVRVWGHLDAGADNEATAYLLAGRSRPPLARLDAAAFEDAVGRAEAQIVGAVTRWTEVGSVMAAGDLQDAGPAGDMLEALLPTLSADVDLASVMMRLPHRASAPVLRHGVRTAVMAMHLARQVGYAPDRVVDAGLVGLVQDLGMMRVPAEVRDAPRRLTAKEWEAIRRHPAYAADLLENVSGLRPDIAIAVYQHHERLDGSGYPHGRKGMFLHPMAKLVAVADTYAAVCDDRPHRAQRSAHFGVRAVLQGLKAGQLDRDVARVLLETISMYPVGTRVELSDHHRGEVYRTNDGQPSRPVVALLDEAGQPGKKKRDLAFDDTLSILKVIESERDPLAQAAA